MTFLLLLIIRLSTFSELCKLPVSWMKEDHNAVCMHTKTVWFSSFEIL